MLQSKCTARYLQSVNLSQSSACVYLEYFYCDSQQFDKLSLNSRHSFLLNLSSMHVFKEIWILEGFGAFWKLRSVGGRRGRNTL